MQLDQLFLWLIFRGSGCAGEWLEKLPGSALIRNWLLLEWFPIVLAIELWGQSLGTGGCVFICNYLWHRLRPWGVCYVL